MKTWAVLAAKHAALTSGVSFSVIPAIGTASLDGFALGAVLAGALFAALSSSRRGPGSQLLRMPASRKRPASTWSGRFPVARIRPGRPSVAWAWSGRLTSARLRPGPSHLTGSSRLTGTSRLGLLASASRRRVAVRPACVPALVESRAAVSAPVDQPVHCAAPAGHPAFLPAPVDQPTQSGQPWPAERSELTRPYSSQAGPARELVPEQAGPPERLAPSEHSGRAERPAPSERPGSARRVPSPTLPDFAAPPELPARPVRPEGSRPYAQPAATGRSAPAVASAIWLPAVAESAEAGPLARFRRRMDGMLAEMLGDDSDDSDDSDELAPHSSGEPDEAFWGPGERKGNAPTNGYRSKHRLNDPAAEPRQAGAARHPDGQRNLPRHAAPPASFSAKLTGRSAAHAAW